MSVWRAPKVHTAASHSALVASHFISYHYNHLSRSIVDAEAIKEYDMDDICNHYGCQVQESHGATTVCVLKKLLDEHHCNIDIKDTGHKSRILSGLIPDMPSYCDVSSNMMPDAIVYARDSKLLFCAEEASTQPSSDLRKSCYYASYPCRYFSYHNSSHPGVCVVFPNRAKWAVFIVTCTWSYEIMKFVYEAEAVNLEGLKDMILKIFNRSRTIVLKDCANQNYLFKLGKNEMEKKFSPINQQYEFNFQYPSSGSIVMNVTQKISKEKCVLKITSLETCCVLTALKARVGDVACILHFLSDEMDQLEISLPVLRYSVCDLGPLSVENASLCLFDFVKQLSQVLITIHTKKVEHCDLRLENICFRLNDDRSFKIVLIDFDLAKFTNKRGNWKEEFIQYNSSCMYSNIEGVDSVDFLQLGWMILWVHYYDSLKNNYTESNYHLYHNMHRYKKEVMPLKTQDGFIARLITLGKLCFTMGIVYYMI